MRWLATLVASLTILVAVSAWGEGRNGAGPAGRAHAKQRRHSDQGGTRAAESVGAKYVGAGACSRCHVDIYKSFSRTSMGRSMRPVTEEFLRSVPATASIYDAKLNRHFEVKTEDGKLFESEFEVDAAGREVFRNTQQIKWIVGTGANGLGGLIEREDYLLEAPVSYYTEGGRWDLSPGYERGDYGFNRVVGAGCINCHSGRPKPVAESEGKYQKPAFEQLAVGCENCHGPGSAHVNAMDEGESFEKDKDTTIVNPARLSRQLSDDICMSCHQTGDVRVFQPGKTYQDFRPGTSLNRVMAILMVPPTKENPPREDHVEHYYSMTMSMCYRGSLGKPDARQMRCTTCHDPHLDPTAEEAPAVFNGKCMQCHTEWSCKEAESTRRQTKPVADNCVSCHMQKRTGVAITHTSITNHRIVRKPDEPFPEVAFAQTTAKLKDLIYLNHVEKGGATDGEMPPAVTLLKAYADLGAQGRSYAGRSYEDRYLELLRELEKAETVSAVVEAGLGHQALNEAKLDEAALHLHDSLKLDANQPAVYSDLAVVAAKKGQGAEAVAMARRAVALEPFSAPRRKALVLQLIDAREYGEAEVALRRYIADFPEDDFMRKMLAMVSSQ